MRYLLFALVLTLSTPGLALEPEPNFERWEKEIAALEARDAKQKIEPGGVVFVGSSSIRLWDLKASFPDLAAVNHGFGGSTVADSLHFVDRLVLRWEPRTIVFYAGDNDIAQGKSPQQVHEDFAAFLAAVRKKLPETKMVYIPIKPSPSRWKLFAEQQDANARIQVELNKDPHSEYLDIVTPMLGDDGQPRSELFQKDMLHLNAEGYALWNKLLAPHLK